MNEYHINNYLFPDANFGTINAESEEDALQQIMQAFTIEYHYTHKVWPPILPHEDPNSPMGWLRNYRETTGVGLKEAMEEGRRLGIFK